MSLLVRALSLVCALLNSAASHATSLQELHNDATLTPQTFAHHFSTFRFSFRSEVQKPEDFLASQSGDCDDYSTLADSELSARGYHTRLIAVRMRDVVHVVCYITEANAYLDFNKRARGNGLVSCGGSVTEIANSVAKSFSAQWTSTSEFTYGNGLKRLVSTTVPQKRFTHN